jgi:hypothetical protein
VGSLYYLFQNEIPDLVMATDSLILGQGVLAQCLDLDLALPAFEIRLWSRSIQCHFISCDIGSHLEGRYEIAWLKELFVV